MNHSFYKNNNTFFRTFLWVRLLLKNKLINNKIYYLTIFLSLLSSLVEAIGFSAFIPLIEFMKSINSDNDFIPQTYITEIFIDLFNFFGVEISLLKLSIFLFIIVLLRQVLITLQLIFTSIARYNSWQLISVEFFKQFLNVKYKFIDNIKLAEFSSIMHDDIKSVTIVLTIFLVYVQAFFMLLGYGTIMIVSSPIVSIGAILLIAIITLLLYPIIKRTKKASTSNMGLRYNYINSLNEYFRSLREIKVYLNYDKVIENFKTSTLDYCNSYVRVQRHSAIYMLFFIPLVLLFLLIIINFLFSTTNVSLETLLVLVMAMVRLIPLGRLFSNKMNQFATIEPSLNRSFNFYSRIKATKENNLKLTSARLSLNREIRLKNINFKYKDGPQILKNISLSIKAKKITVIKGVSGSGKTTLIDIITRFRDIDAGKIFFDNTDITNISPNIIRKYFSYLPQSTLIINDNILENIRVGDLLSNDSQVKKAAKYSGASFFINKLSKKYLTPAGEIGGKLSGGQKQRIGLSRAILANRPLLILDEPSSALDEKSTKILIENLKKINIEKQYTILIISHNDELIDFADDVIEIENGRVLYK